MVSMYLSCVYNAIHFMSKVLILKSTNYMRKYSIELSSAVYDLDIRFVWINMCTAFFLHKLPVLLNLVLKYDIADKCIPDKLIVKTAGQYCNWFCRCLQTSWSIEDQFFCFFNNRYLMQRTKLCVFKFVVQFLLCILLQIEFSVHNFSLNRSQTEWTGANHKDTCRSLS